MVVFDVFINIIFVWNHAMHLQDLSEGIPEYSASEQWLECYKYIYS